MQLSMIVCFQKKQSEDYQEISEHLEMNTDYLPSITIFDEAWETYQKYYEEKE